MRILLDTNQVLFIVQNPERLSDKARNVLGERMSRVFVSSVSLWEIDLKNRSRNARGESRLPLAAPIGSILEYFLRKGATALPLKASHVSVELERPLSHQDPFDWMHLKQAQAEDLKLLTNDHALLNHPLVISA
ncbi:MAG: type II toxin-antitoxin system VapC family toxin [Pseudomonadota bacterium]